MTPIQLRAAIKTLDAKIDELKEKRNDAFAALCAIYAKFNVGDTVADEHRQYLITNRSLYDESSCEVRYNGRRLKKDGTPFNARPVTLWGKLTLVRKAGAA